MASYEVASRQQPTELLRKAWGWIALRGVVALIFGVVAITLPGVTLAVLVMFWGAYALIDGVVALVAGFRMRDAGVWRGADRHGVAAAQPAPSLRIAPLRLDGALGHCPQGGASNHPRRVHGGSLGGLSLSQRVGYRGGIVAQDETGATCRFY